MHKPDGTVIASTKPVTAFELQQLDLPFAYSASTKPEFSMNRLPDGRLYASILGHLVIDRELIGTMAVHANVEGLHKIILNFTGLGQSGEMLLANRDSTGGTLLLAPTRFNPRAGAAATGLTPAIAPPP